MGFGSEFSRSVVDILTSSAGPIYLALVYSFSLTQKFTICVRFRFDPAELP